MDNKKYIKAQANQVYCDTGYVENDVMRATTMEEEKDLTRHAIVKPSLFNEFRNELERDLRSDILDLLLLCNQNIPICLSLF